MPYFTKHVSGIPCKLPTTRVIHFMVTSDRIHHGAVGQDSFTPESGMHHLPMDLLGAFIISLCFSLSPSSCPFFRQAQLFSFQSLLRRLGRGSISFKTHTSCVASVYWLYAFHSFTVCISLLCLSALGSPNSALPPTASKMITQEITSQACSALIL